MFVRLQGDCGKRARKEGYYYNSRILQWWECVAWSTATQYRPSVFTQRVPDNKEGVHRTSYESKTMRYVWRGQTVMCFCFWDALLPASGVDAAEAADMAPFCVLCHQRRRARAMVIMLGYISSRTITNKSSESAGFGKSERCSHHGE